MYQPRINHTPHWGGPRTQGHSPTPALEDVDRVRTTALCMTRQGGCGVSVTQKDQGALVGWTSPVTVLVHPNGLLFQTAPPK